MLRAPGVPLSFAESSSAPVFRADGSVALLLWTHKLTAMMQIAERVYSLAQEQNNAALMIGAYRALAVPLYYLGDFESARQYAIRGAQIWRSGGVHPPVEEPITPVVACLCFEALSEWHLGEIASCQTTMAEAIAVAKELNDMLGLVLTLHLTAQTEEKAVTNKTGRRQAFGVSISQMSTCAAVPYPPLLTGARSAE